VLSAFSVLIKIVCSHSNDSLHRECRQWGALGKVEYPGKWGTPVKAAPWWRWKRWLRRQPLTAKGRTEERKRRGGSDGDEVDDVKKVEEGVPASPFLREKNEGRVAAEACAAGSTVATAACSGI